MIKQNESYFKSKIKKLLKAMGFWVYSPRDIIRSGIPDLICCRTGMFFGIEIKKETAKMKYNITPLQELNLKAINDRGGYSIVLILCNSVEQYLLQNHVNGYFELFINVNKICINIIEDAINKILVIPISMNDNKLL